MQLITLPFDQQVNTSLQIGDHIYYATTAAVALNDFSTNNQQLSYLGVLKQINPQTSTASQSLTIVSDIRQSQTSPKIGDYLMFQKDRLANSTGIKGYAAIARFVNNNTEEPIELFSVNAQTQESSK